MTCRNDSRLRTDSNRAAFQSILWPVHQRAFPPAARPRHLELAVIPAHQPAHSPSWGWTVSPTWRERRLCRLIPCRMPFMPIHLHDGPVSGFIILPYRVRVTPSLATVQRCTVDAAGSCTTTTLSHSPAVSGLGLSGPRTLHTGHRPYQAPSASCRAYWLRIACQLDCVSFAAIGVM